MRLHRISLAANSAPPAEAFSGKAGLYGKGRWHTMGRLIVYTAEHTSLAMSEALVHIQRSNSIAPYNHWEIEVPDHLIDTAAPLPCGWQGSYAITQSIGDAWLAGKASVGLLVPNAVVPNEMNCLLNPSHSEFSLGWIAAGPFPFQFDPGLIMP